MRGQAAATPARPNLNACRQGQRHHHGAASTSALEIVERAGRLLPAPRIRSDVVGGWAH